MTCVKCKMHERQKDMLHEQVTKLTAEMRARATEMQGYKNDLARYLKLLEVERHEREKLEQSRNGCVTDP